MTFAAREFRAPVDALIEAGRDMAFPLGLARGPAAGATRSAW
jgi:hypothetical protein